MGETLRRGGPGSPLSRFGPALLDPEEHWSHVLRAVPVGDELHEARDPSFRPRWPLLAFGQLRARGVTCVVEPPGDPLSLVAAAFRRREATNRAFANELDQPYHRCIHGSDVTRIAGIIASTPAATTIPMKGSRRFGTGASGYLHAGIVSPAAPTSAAQLWT